MEVPTQLHTCRSLWLPWTVCMSWAQGVGPQRSVAFPGWVCKCWSTLGNLGWLTWSLCRLCFTPIPLYHPRTVCALNCLNLPWHQILIPSGSLSRAVQVWVIQMEEGKTGRVSLKEELLRWCPLPHSMFPQFFFCHFISQVFVLFFFHLRWNKMAKAIGARYFSSPTWKATANWSWVFLPLPRSVRLW